MSAHSLTLYPAIDLKGGQCVRLLHGRMEKATVYNDDPAAQGAAFAAAGFDWLHIVDLDGAFVGDAVNGGAVKAILKAGGAKVQLGGGIRSMAAVEGWLGAGVTRVILGTAAVKDPDFVREAARAFPGRIVVGVDARDGRVKTDGWAGDTGNTPIDVVKRYEDQGVGAVIFTDIGRDGARAGVNIEATAALADAAAIPIIASGGLASTTDIERLKVAHANIEGVILGRALYDGAITAHEALAAAR